MTQSSRRTTIAGGTVVTPTSTIEDGTVTFADGLIVSVGTESNETPDVDATGKYVLPGIIDLHGDDIEHHLFPRPGERVDDTVALDRCDIASASAGITTKYHAIAFEEAPDDNRSVTLARTIADRVRDYDRKQGARVDNRVHLRCELTNPTAVKTVEEQLSSGSDLVSLVSHVPGSGQFAGENSLKQRYEGGSEVTESSLKRLQSRRSEVPANEIQLRAHRIVEKATESNAVVASHDDEDASTVERTAKIGADISEYPLSIRAARRASELGMDVVMGAPNVVRGGSMWDGPNANRAIDDGVVDILCSDFRPQSMLSAVFVDNGETLSDRVRRVSTAPAVVVGLYDRGRLEPGARADVIVVDPDPTPSISRTYVAGREIYRSG